MYALKARMEQFRQALDIHGGAFRLCAAALAVRLSRVSIPSKRLRLRIFRTIYGKKYTPLNEQELEQPLWTYRSVNALFTRGIRPELRPIAQDGTAWLCPCDGRVQDIGTIRQGQILTVKGIAYDAPSLLAEAAPGMYEGGHFAILFLSPTDCHRIFSPQNGRIEEITHIPGRRLVVHPPYQKKEFPVLTLNERVILRLRTPLGCCALVLVAGWGVGNITLPFLPNFRPRSRRFVRMPVAPPVSVKRGDWIATFELGSTAVLITEASEHQTVCVKRDDRVRYGQPLFCQRPLSHSLPHSGDKAKEAHAKEPSADG